MTELKWLQSDWMDFFFTQGSRLVLVICDSVSRHFPIAAKIASRHGQAQQIGETQIKECFLSTSGKTNFPSCFVAGHDSRLAIQ